MHRRRRWLVRGVILAALLGLALVGGLTVVIVRYGQHDHAQPADVIIVLGGGKPGTERRARHAAVLYAQGTAPWVLCTGGVVYGEDRTEAELCAAIAQAAGVPPDALVLENRSRTTEENATETADLMAAHGWQDAILVSDGYHLWRAHWLFRRAGVRAWTSPAQVTVGALPLEEQVPAVVREVLATGYQLLTFL